MFQKRRRYLIQGRLHDVIGAIQVLANWTGGSMRTKFWIETLGAACSAKAKEEDGIAHWNTIFKEHPEFFVLGRDGGVGLKWRRGVEKTFDPVEQRKLTREELTAKDDTARRTLQPRVLNAAELDVLLDSASELHAREIAHAQDKRWWLQLSIPLVGGLIGSMIGSLGAVVASRLSGAP